MKTHLRVRRQMSDTFLTGFFLTLSGGFQDAYSFLYRGEVFANAQTGNIVLMSANLIQGRPAALRYAIPLCAFIIGIFLAELVHQKYKYLERVHWRQLILLAEIVILFAVGFLPTSLNALANALVSFSCAMQVQTFRKISGISYASTMCIGNMRSGTEALCGYFRSRSRKALKSALKYYLVILIFAGGAAIGSFSVGVYHTRAIWISCLLLAAGFLLMFLKEEADEEEFTETE